MKKKIKNKRSPKKGFTLVELLAVIIILTLLSVVLLPRVLETIQNSKQKTYDNQISKIENAADLFVTGNSFDLDEDGVTIVTLQDLADNNYITLPVKNPLTGEDFDPNTTIITITRTSNDIYTYDINFSGSTQYGVAISALYDPLYGSWTGANPIVSTDPYDAFYDGNYDSPRAIYSSAMSYTLLNVINNTDDRQYITIGQNTYTLTSISATNRWIGISFAGCSGTSVVYFSNFKLVFNDNEAYSLPEAVANGYIEPLVVVSSSYNADTYIWDGFDNLISGIDTDPMSYSKGFIVLKVKAVALKGLSFYSSKTFDTDDGLQVKQYGADYDLSTIPFE